MKILKPVKKMPEATRPGPKPNPKYIAILETVKSGEFIPIVCENNKEAENVRSSLYQLGKNQGIIVSKRQLTIYLTKE